jgi:hypothetical protein
LRAADSNGATLIETRIGLITLLHERPGFPSLAVGFKRISTTNEGDKRFASVSQASASKFSKTLVFEEKSANDFYERGMTGDRADLRISFA